MDFESETFITTGELYAGYGVKWGNNRDFHKHQGCLYPVTHSQVRRLTPRECERLQGFPDDYTDIPWRKKDHVPDGPRYKALGNSMAVPVMAWIGARINLVENL